MQCHCAVPRIRGHPSQRALGWVLIVLSFSGLRVHPGFFHPDTALCLQPLGPQWGHSRLRSHLPCLGFYAVSAVGPHCSSPGRSFHSCCPWCFKSLYLQLSGVPVHRLAVPACDLETFRGTARPPLTCASRSGGTPTPCACSDFAGPLRRLDVGIKATLCESVVLLLFAIRNGLEACHSPSLG